MPLRRGDLSAIIEEHQRTHPFVMGDLRFTREIVQMIDQGFENEFETRPFLGLETILHRIGDRELVDIAHCVLPFGSGPQDLRCGPPACSVLTSG